MKECKDESVKNERMNERTKKRMKECKNERIISERMK